MPLKSSVGSPVRAQGRRSTRARATLHAEAAAPGLFDAQRAGALDQPLVQGDQARFEVVLDRRQTELGVCG
jgi:hypothetical protein